MATNTWEDMAAMVIGGIAGSMAGALLVRGGIRPDHAAAAVAAGGVAVALAGSGGTRLAGVGAAATGTGQLAMAWLERERELAAVRNGTVDPDSVLSPEARHRISQALDRAFARIDRENAARRVATEDETEAAAHWADIAELGDRADEFDVGDGPTGVGAPGVRIPDGLGS